MSICIITLSGPQVKDLWIPVGLSEGIYHNSRDISYMQLIKQGLLAIHQSVCTENIVSFWCASDEFLDTFEEKGITLINMSVQLSTRLNISHSTSFREFKFDKRNHVTSSEYQNYDQLCLLMDCTNHDKNKNKVISFT